MVRTYDDGEDSWQLVAADARTGGRVLLGLLGTLTVLVGLLCLRAPLQTAVVLGLLIGATWVVGGVGTFHAINDGPPGGRGWRIASGLLSVLGGAVVLIYAGVSLVTLTWLAGHRLASNRRRSRRPMAFSPDAQLPSISALRAGRPLRGLLGHRP